MFECLAVMHGVWRGQEGRPEVDALTWRVYETTTANVVCSGLFVGVASLLHRQLKPAEFSQKTHPSSHDVKKMIQTEEDFQWKEICGYA